MLSFTHSKVPVVLVDDEQTELDAYSFLLQSMGVNQIIPVKDSRKLAPVVEGLGTCVLFLDLNMPHKHGKEVLVEMRQDFPQIPVVIITANSDIEMAVECLKLGAHDYLVKPINMNTFGSALRNALEICSLRNEVMTLKGVSFARGLKNPEYFAEIISENAVMTGLFQYIESIAPSREPALILGETGSGKELFARAVHRASGLSGEFVAVDVAGLDDNLFSDTLFGHRKGAYTGADKDRAGLVEKAGEGTLFLDEIGDLAPASQVRLLRLLQEGIYYPLGTDSPRTSRARIITATNKGRHTLASGTEDGFRQDLFFRLSTHLLQVPPLRRRSEDIPLLTRHLAEQAAKSMGKPVPEADQALLDLLAAHSFPGNIRELKTYVYDAVARCEGERLSADHIRDRIMPGALAAGASGGAVPDSGSPGAGLESLMGTFPTLNQLVEYAIDRALEKTDQNQTRAARLLGISKQALSKRLKNRNPS